MNPTQVTFTLPTQNEDGSPLKPTDIKQINIGIRPKSGTAGTYPLLAADIAFTADANGVSHEPLSVFGLLAPGDYFAAAQTVTLIGTVSAWSSEASFTIAPPVPKSPANLAVS